MSQQGASVGPLTGEDVQALLRAAYLLTGDRSEAQDLVQAVLLRMLEGGLPGIETPRAYAKRALVNRFISERRRTALADRKLRLFGLRDEQVGGHDQRVVDREAVRAAMRRLRPKERAAVVLRYWDDQNDAQIAQILRCRETTVRSLLSRARASMRAALEEEQK